MRLIIGLILALLALSVAVAQDEDRPRCDNCGMFWDTSPTRVEFTVKVDGKEHTHMAECFGCLHDYIHDNYGEVMPTAISVLDYATFDTKNEKMIDAFDSYFLYGTKRLPGSMPPYVAAFASEEAAREHQEELGGELVEFAGMRKLMMKAKGEEMEHGHEEPGSPGHAEEKYVCPCSGDCCADIRSDSPGECPNCGMQLVMEDQG